MKWIDLLLEIFLPSELHLKLVLAKPADRFVLLKATTILISDNRPFKVLTENNFIF